MIDPKDGSRICSMEIEKTYVDLIDSLKREIKQARMRAHMAVNRELIVLYWKIGKNILERQRTEGWGSKVIESISRDLRKEFPEMKGLSPRNLKYMRKFADELPDFSIVQQAAAQIPWFHVCTILDKTKDHNIRLWYIQQTIEHGWSRNVLVHQIESDLFARQGKAITNFKTALPAEQSDLAQQIVKSSYNLQFLDVENEISEKKLEKSLIEKIRDFLLELGTGFAFVGNQYHMQLDNKEYYLDLLFYHLKLRSYVVIELKTGEFRPEYAGKLNFYINMVDAQMKATADNPTLGLILCKSQSGMEVEYSLKGLTTPIGVSQFQLTKILPKELLGQLPTAEELSYLGHP